MQRIPMPQNYVDAVKEAQKKCSKQKQLGSTVTCPFLWNSDKFDGQLICQICHTWMGSDQSKFTHPCNAMSYDEKLKRFWRSTSQ